MSAPTPPPKDYVTPEERLSGQDWSGVAKTGLASMAPADKGWVLAVVVIIAILQGSDYFSSVSMIKRFETGMTRMGNYLELVENDRRQAQMDRTEERKELIRIVENLTMTVSRQANRAGRSMTAEQAVQQAKGMINQAVENKPNE